jgi:malate/lactate dehydrogenase
MTQYEVIGIGRMGSAIIYTMMLLEKGNTFYMREFHPKNKRRAFAEQYDLRPVAKATGNHLLYYTNKKSDAYIITAGLPRENTTQTKQSLFKVNREIMAKVMKDLPKDKPIFIITNPPNELAKHFSWQGYRTVALRQCTDSLRNSTAINDFVLTHKGYTQWTPAYACATYILEF